MYFYIIFGLYYLFIWLYVGMLISDVHISNIERMDIYLTYLVQGVFSIAWAGNINGQNPLTKKSLFLLLARVFLRTSTGRT